MTSEYDYGKKPDYQAITVEQWADIPADKTEYSAYWEDPNAFQPEVFSENTKKETKWNDLGWMIAFWINFVLFVALFIVLVVKGRSKWDEFFGIFDDDSDYDDGYDHYSNDNLLNKLQISNGTTLKSPNDNPNIPQNSIQKQNTVAVRKHKRTKSDEVPEDEETEFTTKVFNYSIGFGVLAAVIVNVIHSIYISLAPMVYIKAGFFIIVIIAVLACIPAILFGIYAILAFPAIVAILMIAAYCCLRKKIPLSSAILKQSCRIMWKNPMIFAVIFIEFILEMIVGVIFIFSVLFVLIVGWNYAVYLYFLLAFYWIANTFSYTAYMATAGIAAQWYFLNGTEYMPRCGVWESFKRAVTTSFGSAAFAGFILSVIEFLETLADSNGSNGNGCALLRCIALCILACIKCCFSVLTQFALIYCATFGVPFLEGCRRWLELESKKFVGTLLNSCMISTAIAMHVFVFSLAGAMLGLGFAFMLMSKNLYLKILLSIFAFLFSLCIFSVLATPIRTFSDTLFVCFAESPENLKTSAADLYEQMVDVYGYELHRQIQMRDDRP